MTFNFSLFLLVLLVIAILKFYVDISSDSLLPLVLISLPVIFIFVWLVWGELRTKILKISIENDKISVKNFQGLGISKVFYFSEIDGFKTSILPSEYKDFEYLYLIKSGHKIVKVSEFYHKNYSELKMEISKKCKNLGTQKFNIVREFIELFA
ncbi:MAG: hypothetical protein ABIN89_26070 [Chitinophagaceae bacterium]